MLFQTQLINIIMEGIITQYSKVQKRQFEDFVTMFPSKNIVGMPKEGQVSQVTLGKILPFHPAIIHIGIMGPGNMGSKSHV